MNQCVLLLGSGSGIITCQENFVCDCQVDFEPEYAMEYFGINPDIDETPRMSLEETLNKAKDFLMVEGMTEEQWQVLHWWLLLAMKCWIICLKLSRFN